MSKFRKRLDDDDDEGHISESWLIPYADILTLLLALFIVLFAASNVDKVKYQSIMESFKSELTGTKIPDKNSGLSTQLPNKKSEQVSKEEKGAQIDPELEQMRQQLEKYLADNHLNAVITLQDTKRGIEISLQEVVLFDSGKADIKQNSYQTLSGILGLINTVPNPINIEGHTDDVPIHSSSFPSNWELSGARAASVLHFFEARNIVANRLQFTGYGEQHPLFPNDSDEHRQANRRVTIVVLRNN
ncbi:flagellar motor protein MotB [Bacillus sp. 1NLA3E]|uniref:flagellar motor protein MotB n=1 Tax=Bacillus sp. 1NLA3E TaxID=666686 RepID=UPI000247F43A|nr:flagellar motor protein MotB [Bacillus sp. 1NLA3E]AGK55405.1 OmpA/MotB domain-containing protein [Bacillus sp. 1NLA3E]